MYYWCLNSFYICPNAAYSYLGAILIKNFEIYFISDSSRTKWRCEANIKSQDKFYITAL